MIAVSNAGRVVFPQIGKTKGDVVAYYDRIAKRALPHLLERPLSIKRYPKGLAGPGFFQKNVPNHYPSSFARFEVPRSTGASKKHPEKTAARDVTVYPIAQEVEHLPYLANQGALELHVPTARAISLFRPDRVVIDLDPPPGAFDRVRRAAHLLRAALEELGLRTAPIATGSKGYHLVAPIVPSIDADVLASALQKLAALQTAAHPEDLTTAFRIANRGGRVFIDWLRNRPLATVVAPYSLRARPTAPVATPLAWSEVDVTAPDGFTIADVDRLLDRSDPLAELAERPSSAEPFIAGVDEAFERSGMVLEGFDRFRS